MQCLTLLHEILENSRAVTHKTRLHSLVKAVESVTQGANLSLTSLGRCMQKSIKPRSKIQEINYLLNNGHLHKERADIYAAINRWVVGKEKCIYVALDWSSIVAHQQHLLRASLLVKGRCMTAYEEVHAESELGKTAIHQRFLKNLKKVLPEGIDICLIVDAGFRTDFYIDAMEQNFDYVGRILSNMHYCQTEEKEWEPCTNLYERATEQPQALGRVKLTKANKLDSQLYIYKKDKVVKSQTKPRKITYGKKEKEHKNAASKPWLIASSCELSAEQIMRVYSKRMKIEHDFRDTKDTQWGMGIKASRTVEPSRLIIQLLIGFLASFVLWLIGLCLEKKGLHRDFQANSIKHKRVLSLIFLALEAIKSGYMKFITKKDLLLMRKDGLSEQVASG